jgi:hypothetical protein
MTLVDPFLYRSQDVWLSPFPLLKTELALLLIAGVLLMGLSAGFFGRLLGSNRQYPLFSHDLIRHLAVAVTTSWIVIGVFELGSVGLPFLIPLVPFYNVSEFTILLFVFYVAVATLPLIFAMEYLVAHLKEGVSERRPTLRPRHDFTRGPQSATAVILAVLVISGPLVSGVVVTTLQSPSYLGTIVDDLANVTSGDMAALSWAKANLPTCSEVFVAPGSAAQFLPSYADVRLVFPMDPSPWNGSYTYAFTNMTYGNYTQEVKMDLLELNVTEVFVTGQTNMLWKPILPAPLEGSSDFQVLFHDQDAYVFEFMPAVKATGCQP